MTAGGRQRILIVMPTWVGDVVMATPTLRALRTRFRDAELTLLIRPNTREVVAGGSWMDRVVELPPKGRGGQAWSNMLRARRQLRPFRFDWAILLSNSFRSALLTALSRIPRRTGYARDGRGWLLTDRLSAPRSGRTFKIISTVQYYNNLARHLGCPDPGEQFDLATLPTDEAVVEQRLRDWGIAEHHPLVVINPGAAFGLSKLWLPERYAEVADRLVRSRDARVIVTCGPNEESLAWQIADAMTERPYVVDRPRGTLGQLKALIRRSDLLLNNDTGPRHFAKAFQRPVVTVFGSTHPGWTNTAYPWERQISVPVDCGPCQQKICPTGTHECMTGVTVEMVAAAAEALLDGQHWTTALPVVTANEPTPGA